MSASFYGADERVVYSDDPWNADCQRFHDHSRRGCGDGSVLVNVDNSFMNDIADIKVWDAGAAEVG